jgi:transcriptional regulator with XRE-family HTH domain
MARRERTTNAVEILHRRYVGEDAARATSLQEERVNAEVARTILELRQEAGLTQRALAESVGTTQSVISRLEDAGYEGHSLSMLKRIAMAINCRVAVSVVPRDPENATMRYVFREVVRRLRMEMGLTVDQFAKESGIDRETVIAMERDVGFRPTPLMIHRLSKFYRIPERRLAFLAGAITEVPQEIRAEASRFAAHSESFSKLTDEERRSLDEFVGFLRSEGETGSGC